MAFSRDVIVRIPGPAEGGDTWGGRWAEFNNSPGPITFRAKAIARESNGDMLVEKDGEQRLFQPDDDLLTDYTYKFVGKVGSVNIAALKAAVSALTSDPSAVISSTATIVDSLLADDIKQSDLVNLITAAENTNLTDSVRSTAILLVGIIVASEF
tara:strand:- start:15067 stop:15531 length:465 start_codon:yes stop_codon:yes gene_type:complete